MAMTTPTEPLDISRLDTLGMWDVTFGLADQLEAATRRVSDFLPGLPTVDELDHVVVMGMGGSGIAGDVLAALAGPSSPVPVVVVKDPAVPAFVGPRSMVIALSFSGATAETVAGASEALERGARLVSVTSGGPLAALTAAGGGGVLAVDPSIPMPRAALGAIVAPVLAVAEDAGVLDGAREQLAAAVVQLRRRAATLSRGRKRGRGAGPHHRAHLAAGLRRRAARRRRRRPLEEPGQRERQGAGLLPHAARGLPQRAVRMGPAR